MNFFFFWVASPKSILLCLSCVWLKVLHSEHSRPIMHSYVCFVVKPIFGRLLAVVTTAFFWMQRFKGVPFFFLISVFFDMI